MIPVLAIDGPSGSGKGAVGMGVAERLGWHYLDSGAVYRALGLAASWAQVACDDERELRALAAALDLRFAGGAAAEPQVYVNGRECSVALRGPEAADAASRVAALAGVRQALLDRQRAARRSPGLVADGRDMGSHVFPDAFLKVFLTASPEVRAERRYNQLKAKGFGVTLPQLIQEIRERDERDANRAVAPLKPAPDAVVLDSSALGLQDVINRVLTMVSRSA
ncbi:(d)CMP kinase [Acidiferrobacter sp. SPIII_3]|uniref:(d)CMP kinase n=1 Tax=Acidiferrobacter sp. SPIII_3 TaxID=1281578 RepID=UPI000D72C529|nr:(d)CMP kinase [Acidiferrobacter sp. SPIII_3]AWP23971.1 (d)CMP kinase [Acidiferrobacter sp. SPIII_3]